MNTQSTEITTINKLPNEIIDTIFENLDALTQKSFREVCKKFHSFKNTKIIINVNDSQTINLDDQKRIKYLTLQRDGNTDINIQVKDPILSLTYLKVDGRFNNEILKKFPNLRHLICKDNSSITIESISHLELTTLVSPNCHRLTFDVTNGIKKEKFVPSSEFEAAAYYHYVHYGDSTFGM